MADRIVLKRAYKYPVPTAAEVNCLFNLAPEYSAIKLGLAMIAIQGLRPAEVPRLRWHNFGISPDGCRVLDMHHIVYKPSRRVTSSGLSLYYKQVKKRIHSPWLSDQLLHYGRSCPSYENSRVFPWTTPDSLQKWLAALRKGHKRPQNGPERAFLRDPILETLKGQSLTRYRVTLYALRRFCFTFLYYSRPPVGFGQDSVALARYMGHSRPDTTLQYYVMPKHAIGLTDAMIARCVNFDQFIKQGGRTQATLPDYLPGEPGLNRFLTPGQTTLAGFMA
jgi:integrase